MSLISVDAYILSSTDSLSFDISYLYEAEFFIVANKISNSNIFFAIINFEFMSVLFMFNNKFFGRFRNIPIVRNISTNESI